MAEPRHPRKDAGGQSPGTDSTPETFADFLQSRPAMQDEIDHIHFRGRLLSSGVEGRFILAVPGQSSVLEAMNTDVVSFKKLEGEEADMVEVVMPKNAIVRTVQFCKTEEVANMTWSYGPRSGGYGGAAAWKDAGYWGRSAMW